MNTSVPPEPVVAGVYSSHSVPSSTVPRAGDCSMPTSVTESPSGSMPLSGTGMRLVSPLTAQAVRACGRGAALACPEATTSKVTVEVAEFPAESRTV